MSYGALAGAGVAGILGSLFGSKPSNPYANQLTQAANDLGNIRSGYEGETAAGQQGYNEFNPQNEQAINQYADYLRTDPYTDQYSTQVLGQATQGTNAAYDQAKSNLAAEMARRGISGSSVDNGSMASIESARAGDIAAAQNQLAQAKVQSQQGRLSALTGLLGGATQQYAGQENQGLEGQAGATQGMASIYGGLNEAANQANEQTNAQMTAGLGALGSAAGTYLANQGNDDDDDTTTTKARPGYTSIPNGLVNPALAYMGSGIL